MRKSGCPFLTNLPILKEDFFQISGNPGNQLDRHDGLGIAGQLQIIGHRPLQGLSDRNCGRRRWRLVGFCSHARRRKDRIDDPAEDLRILRE